jgi:biopolymer transport protein ExbD
MPRPIRIVLVLAFVLAGTVRLSQEGRPVPAPSVSGVLGSVESPEESQIVLHYSADRQIRINGDEVPRHALAAQLESLYRGRTDRTLWLDGDGSLRYGEIVDVIEAAKSAGVGRVGVVTPGMRRAR